METYFGDFFISDSKDLIQINRVYELLSDTYWADTRPRDAIQKSIENSLCFGVYKDVIMVGFARCVTDYAVLYYLCDVVIDKEFRGKGLGKALMKAITEHEMMSPLLGLLGTRDAHGLYEQFGFKRAEGSSMRKSPEKRSI